MWVYFLVSEFKPLPHLTETLHLVENPPKVENGAIRRLLVQHSAGKITFLVSDTNTKKSGSFADG